MVAPKFILARANQTLGGQNIRAQAQIASLYLIGLAAALMVLSDWLNGRFTPSEGATLVLILACIGFCIRRLQPGQCTMEERSEDI